MKNKFYVIAFVAIVAAVASFTSCKKDRTCVCTYKYSPTGTIQSTSEVYAGTTKGDAKDACDQKKSTLLNSGYIEVDCNVN